MVDFFNLIFLTFSDVCSVYLVCSLSLSNIGQLCDSGTLLHDLAGCCCFSYISIEDCVCFFTAINSGFLIVYFIGVKIFLDVFLFFGYCGVLLYFVT